MHETHAILVPYKRVSPQLDYMYEHITALLASQMKCSPLVVRQSLLIDPVNYGVIDLLFNLILGQDCALHPILDVLVSLLQDEPTALSEVVGQEMQNLDVAIEGTLMDEGVAKPVNCENQLVNLHFRHFLADLNK